MVLLHIVHSFADSHTSLNGIQLVLLGNRVNDQDTAGNAHLSLDLHDLSQLSGCIHTIGEAESAAAYHVLGHLVCAVADDRNTLCLQVFHGQIQIQDRLCTGTYDHHSVVCQGLKVGGDIHGLLRADLSAADTGTAGDRAADHSCCRYSCRDGHNAVRPLGQKDRDISCGCLKDRAAFILQIIDLIIGQADVDDAADNGDESRACAVVSDGLLHILGEIIDSGIDHAAESSCTFHDNDRFARIDCMLYFVGEDDIVLCCIVDLDFLKHVLICCGSFLMDCGEELDKSHPGIDIVMEIRGSDQFAVIREKIAGGRLIKIIFQGKLFFAGFNLLQPGHIHQFFCLYAEPSVRKDIEPADASAVADHSAADRLHDIILIFIEGDDILGSIFGADSLDADMVRGDRNRNITHHDLLARITKG